eukprot:GHVO01013410.1.p1 GENE.GHVO01013410.1~~GHVO01013410.1.p1  ORF type:complete len:551 (-),score=83.25 GHVO01013410.1:71-1684(-)
MQAPIILLREGTDTSQGRGQLFTNITACVSLADIARTTLGPRGMDKLICENGNVTVTNDGATVMRLLNVVHPAAKILVDIAEAQDNEVGDGTTSVVLFAAALLKEARVLMEDGLQPQVIIKGFREAQAEALWALASIEIKTSSKNTPRDMLLKCAETTLTSKLLSSHRELFARMAVDAVMMLKRPSLERHLIGIKTVTGGSVSDSLLINGVAFKKTFSYAGFEQQPKKFGSPNILLLNIELELKAEKENAEIRVSNSDDYQKLVDAEWDVIGDKLELIASSGAQVVLSRLPIGDLATQFFADRSIFSAGRVDDGDMKRAAAATGASILSSVNHMSPSSLGTCGTFEEIQIGNDRYNIFGSCAQSKSATIILRGGATQFLEEAERSLHDAIEVVRRAVCVESFVGGGGSTEMELSKHIRDYSRDIPGKLQFVVNGYARALEVIPHSLALNSGLDCTEILNRLRHKHASSAVENRWWGVDCVGGQGIINAMQASVMEPSVVKHSMLNAATEAACMIISVDERIKNPKSNPEPDGPNARR